MTAAQVWPRDAYRRAVFASDLRVTERMVALAYAERARDRTFAWLTYTELKRMTGIASNDTVTRTVAELVERGWLHELEPAKPRRSARFELRIPGEPAPVVGAPMVGASDDADTGRAPTSGAGTAPTTGAASEPGAPTTDIGAPMSDVGAPMVGAYQSADHSPEGSSDRSTRARASGADAPTAEHADAVAWLVAEHGPALTEAEALLATDSMAAWARRKGHSIRSMRAFVVGKSLEELRSWAGTTQKPGPASQPSRADAKGRGTAKRCKNGMPIAAVDGSCCTECAEAAPPGPRRRAAEGDDLDEVAS